PPMAFQVDVTATASLLGIGDLAVVGVMRIDNEGLTTHMALAVGADLGKTVGLKFTANALFDLNTSSQTKTLVVRGDCASLPNLPASGTAGTDANNRPTCSYQIASGFKLGIYGSVTLGGMADASGHVVIALQGGAFTMEFDVALNIGGLADLGVSAKGFAGIYADGIALRLAISIDANIGLVIKVVASGELRLNTSQSARMAGNLELPKHSFLIDVTGKLVLLQTIKFDAHFLLAIGAGEVTTTVDQTVRTHTLGANQWLLAISAEVSFFGFARMYGSGWVRDDGQFELGIGGHMDLGSGGFGLFGRVDFHISYTQQLDRGVMTSIFDASFHASVDARLFGISFAGVEFGADLHAQGAGPVDLIADVTVRIRILFFTISKSASFKIGTLELPNPVYLAGDKYGTATNGQPVVSGDGGDIGTAEWHGGELWLNVGARAQPAASTGFTAGRGVGNSDPNEVVYIEHISTTATGERIRVYVGGRDQVFNNVTSIHANFAGGNDMLVIREGVVSDVVIEGGGGNDTIVYLGSGQATLRGGAGDDYLEVGSAATGILLLEGGDGNDFLTTAGLRAVTMRGGAGDDVLHGSPAADLLDGGTGNDQIDSMGGADTIDAGAGDDLINVILTPTTGSPTIAAGAGDDYLSVVTTTGNDVIDVAQTAAGADGVTVTRADGSATTFVTATNLEFLSVDLGPGADALTVHDISDTSLRGLTVTAGKFVRDTGATADVVDDPKLDNNPGNDDEKPVTVKMPVLQVTDDGQPDVIRIIGRDPKPGTHDGGDAFAISADLPISGVMTQIRVSQTTRPATGPAESVADYFIKETVRSEGDTLIVEGAGGNDLLDASGLGDPDPAAAPLYTDMVALKLIGGAGDDRLVGTPYNDYLDSGTGSDTVTGGPGFDTFVDASAPCQPGTASACETDTLVETQNADIALFGDLFVVGRITNAGIGDLSTQSDLIAQMRLDDPTVRAFGDADRFAAGAIAEPTHGIFEAAVITGGSSGNTFVVNDVDNTIYLNGVATHVSQWQGDVRLDNRGAGTDTLPE
ncbi:MAG: mucin9, partial [Actinomycetota bacterium]|nr:mucin9 [Actinomycetota bacterium]